jgi:hypothetical protein
MPVRSRHARGNRSATIPVKEGNLNEGLVPEKQLQFFKTIGLIEDRAYYSFPSSTRAVHSAFAMTFSLILNQQDFRERVCDAVGEITSPA